MCGIGSSLALLADAGGDGGLVLLLLLLVLQRRGLAKEQYTIRTAQWKASRNNGRGHAIASGDVQEGATFDR